MDTGQSIDGRGQARQLPLRVRGDVPTLLRLRAHTMRRREIAARLVELDREWDVAGVLEFNLSLVALAGIALATLVHPYWIALVAVVVLCMLQHALRGWCPAVPVLLRLGYRTRAEIDREKYALKAMRGDFEAVPASPDRAARAFDAVWKT